MTNIYHIPHGEACGLTLDYFVRINAERSRGGKDCCLCKETGICGHQCGNRFYIQCHASDMTFLRGYLHIEDVSLEKVMNNGY